jgi:predicted phosphodiesterase
MSLKIQIVSDLHLEFHATKERFNFLKPTAPILALVGDICCLGTDKDFSIFKRFIMEILPNYEIIIFVSGNHEMYVNDKQITVNQTIEGINYRIRAFFKETSKKLHYLQNNTLKITSGKKQYYIIGATLWTNIPVDQHARIEKMMSDYTYIYTTDKTSNKIRKITPIDICSIFRKSYTYIKSQLAKASAAKAIAIVLTHHRPLMKPTYNVLTYDPAYMSDCSALFAKPLALWAFGHVHEKVNITVHGVRFYSNCKGYPYQKTCFSHDEFLTI